MVIWGSGRRFPAIIRLAGLIVLLSCVCPGTVRPGVAQPEDDIPVGTVLAADVSYGPLPVQKLDLYYRPGMRLPLVIFIHGGGWNSGDKSENRARGFINRNFAVANINYRLASEAPFPANIRDCQRAVRWLRANAEKYDLDTSRIGVLGQSAGGQLAALLGTAGDYKFAPEDDATVSARVQAVVEISGVTDFSLFGSSKPGNGISQFFGAPMSQVPEMVRLASPKTFVSRDSPRFLIVHGGRDTLVPLKHAFSFRAALSEASLPVAVRVLTDERHEFTPSGWSQALQWAEDFFVEQLQAP
jgi:acetyl esterase/lipase